MCDKQCDKITTCTDGGSENFTKKRSLHELHKAIRKEHACFDTFHSLLNGVRVHDAEVLQYDFQKNVNVNDESEKSKISNFISQISSYGNRYVNFFARICFTWEAIIAL